MSFTKEYISKVTERLSVPNLTLDQINKIKNEAFDEKLSGRLTTDGFFRIVELIVSAMRSNGVGFNMIPENAKHPGYDYSTIKQG